jgi:hypothetical protein
MMLCMRDIHPPKVSSPARCLSVIAIIISFIISFTPYGEGNRLPAALR